MNLLIKHLLFVSFLFLTFYSRASFSAFISNVEISSSKGSVNGYIHVYHLSGMEQFDSIVASGEIKYLYRSKDSNPQNYPLYYRNDTLDVYQDMFRIDSLDANVFFKDKLFKIAFKDIKFIKELSTIETSAYQLTWVTATSNDKTWLTRKFVSKEEIVYNYNEWLTIYYFEDCKGRGKLKDLYQKLEEKYENGEWPEDEQQSWYKEIEKYLKSLNGKKVIMISAFSD